MKEFFKENSYNFVKCILNQVAMTMFGLMLAFATIQNETYLLISSLFSIAFYLFLTYIMFWEIGGKDRIREDNGRKKKTPMHGFLICLVANIPNLIMGIIICLTKNAAAANEAAGNIYFVVNMLARGLEAMYLGLITLYSPNNPIAFLLICLPAPIMAEIAYLLGNHNFRIAGIFGIKPNLKDETR